MAVTTATPAAVRRFPVSLVLVGMLSLQFSSAFAQGLFDRIGPTGATVLRVLISSAVLLLVTRPRVVALLRRHWRLLLPYGAVLAVMQLAFYEAIARLPLGVVVTLEFTGPLLVGLCCSRKAADVGWIVLAGTGVLLLGGIHALDDPVGVAASLVTGAAFAGYVLLGSSVSRVTSQVSGLAVAMTVAAFLVVPAAALTGPLPVADLTSAPVLAAGLGLALFATVVPFSLEFVALRHIPRRVFVVLVTLEPALAAFIGFLVLREVLSPPQWLAMACVVVAALGATREMRRTGDDHHRDDRAGAGAAPR